MRNMEKKAKEAKIYEPRGSEEDIIYTDIKCIKIMDWCDYADDDDYGCDVCQYH